MKPLHACGVAELSRALQSGAVSSVELTQHLLARVTRHEQLGAFVAVDADSSLAQARLPICRAGGRAHRLTGVPVAHKDVFVTRDWPTTADSVRHPRRGRGRADADA